MCLLGGKELWSTREPNGWAVHADNTRSEKAALTTLLEALDNSDLIRTESKDKFTRQCILQGECWLPAH